MGVKFYTFICGFLSSWIAAECKYLSVKPEEMVYFLPDRDAEEQQFRTSPMEAK
jgi:hypothetical protein